MIIIRDSGKADLTFLAQCVMAAANIASIEDIQAGAEPRTLKVMEEICDSDWSLYWYGHSITAEDTQTGKPVGCLVSYDGAIYEKARKMTFSYAKERLGINPDESDMETKAGEYYLDSMTVLPSYRGQEIGLRLMEAAIGRGMSAGHRRFSLIADKDAPRLRKYYESIGFVEDEEIMFFGHPYVRMLREINR
ncbi:MAG: GNAT family N-acetyltransferase [Candidatus Cryptobacteroides sp.]